MSFEKNLYKDTIMMQVKVIIMNISCEMDKLYSILREKYEGISSE